MRFHQQKATGIGHMIAVAPSRTHRKPRTLATNQWHQGFGVIRIGELQVVPFLTEDRACRVAERAAKVIGKQKYIKVFRFADGWCYAILPIEPEDDAPIEPEES